MNLSNTATYITPTTTFYFPDLSNFQTEVSGINHPVPVRPPADAKIEQVLRNFHFQPVYQKEPEEVHFEAIPAENKTWEKAAELPLSEQKWIPRSDGTISYAFVNTVTTWNWANNTRKMTNYDAEEITALAEKHDGSLIIGDNKGRLHIDKKIRTTGIKLPITEISFVNSTYCLVKFCNGSTCIFDYTSEKIIKEIDDAKEVLLFSSGKIISRKKQALTMHSLDEDGEVIEKSLEVKGEISHIKSLSQTRFLVTHADKEIFFISIWDVNEDKWIATHSDDCSYLHMDLHLLIFIDTETLAISHIRNNRPCIAFFSNGELTKAEYADPGKIDATLLLSDGSIMYATNGWSFGIHVVTREGKITFSKNKELTGNKNIQSLRELTNGSVVVKLEDSIVILKPQLNPQEIKERNLEEQYRTYVSGLIAEAKPWNFYQARRFYEKARKIHPDNQKTCEIFLFFLKQAHNKKLYTQVSLDLNSLNQRLNHELAGKTCKKRLFVGEGDFSYTEAYIAKHQSSHPSLAHAITATEFGSPQGETMKRVSFLIQKGVKVFFGIDGQDLHNSFKGKKFPRIHWNCPFGDRYSQPKAVFMKVIPNFFISCSKLQVEGDRIHITLMQEECGESWKNWKERQEENPIVLGSARAGYCLIRKRVFNSTRYPGYVHTKTNSPKEHPNNGKKREFVFEKTGIIPPLNVEGVQALQNPQQKKYEIKTDKKEDPKLGDYYFECSTDEDSSDGFITDEDSL
jgi:hypothetical protein